MVQQNNLALAKQGNLKAISALMTYHLQPQHITAKATLKDSCLQIILEAAQVPDEHTVVQLIHELVMNLGIRSLKKVKIYGRKTGKDFPDWQREFELESQVDSPSLTSTTAVDRQVSIPSPELEQENYSLPSAQLARTEDQTQENKKPKEPSVWGSLFGAVAGAVGAVGGATAQAGQAVVGTAVGVGGAITSAASQAGEAVVGTSVATGSAAVQARQAVMEIATKTGSEAIALAMSQILQDCTVPAFLLPTGSGHQNFKCTFCFDEAINKLTSGILVRPQVQVWAGRADLDRAHLARILRKDFISQFNAAREQSKAANQNIYASRIAGLKRKQEHSGQEAGKALQSAVGPVATALLLLFFVASPIFSLILFSFAISGSMKGITKGLNYLRLSVQVSGDQNKLKLEQQKLEADFDSKNEAFTQAVNNMTILIHPVLQEVITLFSELDSTPFLPVDKKPTTEFPSVAELLEGSDYLKELPVEYLPLLELVQQK